MVVSLKQRIFALALLASAVAMPAGAQDTTPRGAIGVGKAKQKKSPDPLLSLSEEIASWDHLWRTFGRARSVRHVGIVNF